jgi:putative nucleotidyltransferase with HDIG domain
MTTVEEAKALAESKLAVPCPRRWRHVQSVARQAHRVADRLSLSQDVVVAAWLHDIGYAPELVDTGFHPLDGARYLRRIGVPDRIVRLVAYHSNAIYEARVRGLEQELLAEFEPEESVTYDALVFCDLTTGPDGKTMSFEDRVCEVYERYSDGDISRALRMAEPTLKASVDRISQAINASA